MTTPRLVAFDLDDTLAPSKSPVEPRMAELLVRLLRAVPVAVISGGAFPQFQSQIVDQLGDATSSELARLHLLPTCGTQYYTHDGATWQQVYSETLTAAEATEVLTVVEEQARRLGLWETETWGPILENRGSQITFSALGQSAPVNAKVAWDQDGRKKETLRAAVAALLPELEVRSGGSTSVDITRKGIDKAYGMRKLIDVTGIPAAEMIFVGDRLDEGGNDFPVIAVGVQTQVVKGWEDTAAYLERLIPTF